MLIQADARSLPLVDGCVNCVVTSPPYYGLRNYGVDGQLGLEKTWVEYVETMRVVFAEVYRVLRDDGVCFLNLGDSYASGKGTCFNPGGNASSFNVHLKAANVHPLDRGNKSTLAMVGVKPKDLLGIPWAVAFALRADGWYLRSDIIWSKPNPMPESVTDRPTKAHEYLFLLSKSERYFYDADAIREPYSESTIREAASGYAGTARKEYAAAGAQDPSETKRRVMESVRRREGMVEGYAGLNKNRSSYKPGSASSMNNGEHVKKSDAGLPLRGGGANKRSVWTVPTMPYSGAHFATFPEKLIEPCILAGCPLGGLVLDPFIGSGTTGAVASRFGRRWVGCDLTYFDISKRRTAQRGIPIEMAKAVAGAREGA